MGARIDLEFTGLPQPPLWKRWQREISREGFVAAAIPAMFGVALLSLLGYVLLQRREPATAAAGAADAPLQRHALVEAIARLDDQFAQRELEQDEYLRQRRALKDQALYGAVGGSESDSTPAESDAQDESQPEEERQSGQ